MRKYNCWQLAGLTNQRLVYCLTNCLAVQCLLNWRIFLPYLPPFSLCFYFCVSPSLDIQIYFVLSPSLLSFHTSLHFNLVPCFYLLILSINQSLTLSTSSLDLPPPSYTHSYYPDLHNLDLFFTNSNEITKQNLPVNLQKGLSRNTIKKCD